MLSDTLLSVFWLLFRLTAEFSSAALLPICGTVVKSMKLFGCREDNCMQLKSSVLYPIHCSFCGYVPGHSLRAKGSFQGCFYISYLKDREKKKFCEGYFRLQSQNRVLGINLDMNVAH